MAIDVDTKEVLFNVYITDDADSLRKVSPRKRHPYPELQRAFQAVIGINYTNSRAGTQMTRAEATQVIRQSGIQRTDYVLVLHKAFTDASALRRNMVAEIGEQAVDEFIPPDSHVIRLICFFKHNLGSRADCSLKTLFQGFYPGHPLTHHHHEAEIDIRKLIMMAELGKDYIDGRDTNKERGKIDGYF